MGQALVLDRPTPPAPDTGGAAGNLLRALQRQATLRPQAIAVSAGRQQLDHAGLFAAAERLAIGLRRAGVQRDDVVALMAVREVETFALIVAILLAGAACLPLDADYPAARLLNMLHDARPRLLIAESTAALPPVEGLPRLTRSELASIPTDPVDVAPVDAMGELAYVLFTSGSTGRPKGVAMRSDVLARLVSWHSAHPRLGLAARTLQFAPLGFDVAFQEMLVTFATGGTLVLPTEVERRDPYALLALLARERVERVFVPYVALQAIAEAVAAGGELPLTLRDVVTAGEQLRITPAIRAMFQAVPQAVLHNHYGPTETHVVTAHELCGEPLHWPELPPIGRPLPHVRVRLVDATLGSVAVGEEGELLLGGDCLAAGYIHRPELTAERFILLDGARWYRTGDGVRAQDDGVLSYLGRLDQQIKLDGYRIEPAEIEAVLCRHPAVAEAAVVAVTDVQGRRLVANVVPRDAGADEPSLAAQLRTHCDAQLAAYMVPQSYVLWSLLPLTASGKIDRRALAGDGAQAPLHWPEGVPLAQQLAVLWQQLLGLATIDPHDNLFDLGARSLTVVRALTELRRRGYRTLSAAQIYEHPNVARLTALLAGASAAVSTPSITAVDDAAGNAARGDRQRAALARFGPGNGGTR